MAITQQRLQAIQEARRRLAKASSLGEVRRIRAAADALRLAAKAELADSKVVRLAAELRLVAERKLGQLLSAVVRHGGDRKSAKYAQSAAGLKFLGVSSTQSARWQREASVPDRRFRQYLKEAANDGIEPTAKGLMRLAAARRTNRTAEPFADIANGLRSLARRGKRFACIYAAPPDDAYAASQFRGLAKLPVEAVAAANAHLHLWIVPEALEDGLRLLKAWGFRYASSLACATESASGGGYWRRAHRYLLLGVRGTLAFGDNRIPIAITDRSFKPDALRRMIEHVSPAPRLNLFGTKAAAGWTLAR
jgi:hypothetical protein